MLQSNVSSNSFSSRHLFAAAAAAPAVMAEERLPFTIRLVNDEDDVRKAVTVRHAAYARHLPTLAEKLLMPEATDFEDGVAVLLAESKLTYRPSSASAIPKRAASRRALSRARSSASRLSTNLRPSRRTSLEF